MFLDNHVLSNKTGMHYRVCTKRADGTFVPIPEWLHRCVESIEVEQNFEGIDVAQVKFKGLHISQAGGRTIQSATKGSGVEGQPSIPLFAQGMEWAIYTGWEEDFGLLFNGIVLTAPFEYADAGVGVTVDLVAAEYINIQKEPLMDVMRKCGLLEDKIMAEGTPYMQKGYTIKKGINLVDFVKRIAQYYGFQCIFSEYVNFAKKEKRTFWSQCTVMLVSTTPVELAKMKYIVEGMSQVDPKSEFLTCVAVSSDASETFETFLRRVFLTVPKAEGSEANYAFTRHFFLKGGMLYLGPKDIWDYKKPTRYFRYRQAWMEVSEPEWRLLSTVIDVSTPFKSAKVTVLSTKEQKALSLMADKDGRVQSMQPVADPNAVEAVNGDVILDKQVTFTNTPTVQSSLNNQADAVKAATEKAAKATKDAVKEGTAMASAAIPSEASSLSGLTTDPTSAKSKQFKELLKKREQDNRYMNKNYMVLQIEDALGDWRFFSGLPIYMDGLAEMHNGMFYANKVTHKISQSGYTMDLVCHRMMLMMKPKLLQEASNFEAKNNAATTQSFDAVLDKQSAPFTPSVKKELAKHGGGE